MKFPYTQGGLEAARLSLLAKAGKFNGSSETRDLGEQLIEVARHPHALGAYLIFEQAIEEQQIKQL